MPLLVLLDINLSGSTDWRWRGAFGRRRLDVGFRSVEILHLAGPASAAIARK